MREEELIQLSSQQRALFEALMEENISLGHMYIGALTVLANESNPEHLHQAAHSLRELLEKLPDYKDFPVKIKTENLKVKVREFSAEWKTLLNPQSASKAPKVL